MPIEHTKPYKPEFEDSAKISFETLRAFKLIQPGKENAILESIVKDFESLDILSAQLGFEGELFVDIPHKHLTTEHMVQFLCADLYPKFKYPPVIVTEELWTPGYGEHSYSAKQLGKNTPINKPMAKLAITSRVSDTDIGSDEEPLLHFMDQPYSEDEAEKGEITQLKSIQKWINTCKNNVTLQENNIKAGVLSARGILTIAAQRRFTEEPMPAPIAWGYMRDANLPMVSIVKEGDDIGVVDSNFNEINLWSINVGKNEEIGVGLTLGLEKSIAA